MPPREPEWRTGVPKGRVLAFAPHPDDEAAGIGGVLALHRAQGDAVRIVVATDGTAGDPDRKFDAATYAELRRSESRAGLQLLGVDDVRFWGFPDNRVLSATDLEQGVQRTLAELREFTADRVYLPWEGDGHPDHHALHRIVTMALRRFGFTGEALGFEVWNAMVPDLVVDITAVAQKKEAALLQHRTQISYMPLPRPILGLNAYRSMVHARGQGFCEAFRRIPIH
jgi:LmbE family N-acetylglucosaminyl deacetylase